MLVYRSQRTIADPRRLVADLRSSLRRSGSQPSHDAVVDALIAAGTAESAIADSVFPTADGLDPITSALRAASCMLGHALWHTWRNQPADSGGWWTACDAALAEVELQQLPSTVETTVPEGYAYYAVYPEAYLQAAVDCQAALAGRNVMCLGMRSIGTSLSGAVVGALEELGCKLTSHTLRPRGHPFNRRPVLRADLETCLRSASDSCFLLVDEGPGISGSSLGGMADLLNELGIPDDRIILLPSWRTDGRGLISPVARDHWRRHSQFVTDFENIWLETGRLTETCPPGRLRDVSAGRWRDRVWAASADVPPVQPQHERRKYLLEPDDSREEFRWLSFAGLGGRAEARAGRAEELAAAGFTPAPLGTAHGFLVRRFVPGRPAHPGDADPDLLSAIAAYLAHLSLEYRREPSVGSAAIEEMIQVNVSEGLGHSWLPALEERLPAGASYERPVALDGRMFPHEWIRTADGLLKTDALDHHDDHFFPGCHDIAWDLAAACIEFGLPRDGRRWLIEQYRRLSRDWTVVPRLPGCALSYLAFRLGYAVVAASTLDATPDGERFARTAERYRRLLQEELSGSDGRWDD